MFQAYKQLIASVLNANRGVSIADLAYRFNGRIIVSLLFLPTYLVSIADVK
jgi:hypothetical protein